MRKRFMSTKEHRLLAFSPANGPQQPQGAPEEVNPLVEALEETKVKVESFEDVKAAMETLISEAESGAVKDAESMRSQLQAAAQLAYEQKLGSQVIDSQALDEVNEMFAPALDALGMQFMDADNDGTLERTASAPTTKSEALEQKMKSALAKMQSGDIGKALSAVFEIFGALQEYVQLAKNGGLDDAYESPNSKATRERKERRDKLRKELAGRSVADLLNQRRTRTCHRQKPMCKPHKTKLMP